MALSEWLGAQTLRSVSRIELVPDTWLLWLRHTTDSTLCLQTGDELQCWRESGQVTRVEPYDWRFELDASGLDAGPGREGYLAVFRNEAPPTFWALRSHPELSRAAARPQPLLQQTRPMWWPSPYQTEPRGSTLSSRWREVATIEAPALGPLLSLAVKSLHIRGQGRVPERQDAVIVARGERHRMICARQRAWTCSGLQAAENDYLDAFDVDGTTVALVRSEQHVTDRADDVASRSAAYLELWERSERLRFKGRVQLGALWRDVMDDDAPLTRVQRAS